MKELLDKISSYHFFNYLFPGVLFVVFSKTFTAYSFLQDNLIIGGFVYYFIGLVISRFGSLVIAPILKRISFIKFANYKDYVSASKKDVSIESLLEMSNTYRTLIALFILLFLLKLCEVVEGRWQEIKEWNFYILCVALFLIFLFSYKKQTDFITKRIKAIE